MFIVAGGNPQPPPLHDSPVIEGVCRVSANVTSDPISHSPCYSDVYLSEFVKRYSLQKFQVYFNNLTLVMNKKQLKVASLGLERTN